MRGFKRTSLGPRDFLITGLRVKMKAVGMNPYRYAGLSRNGEIPLEEGIAEMERREASGYRRPTKGGCPKCGSLDARWSEGNFTPTGRYRLQCADCGHAFTKAPKFVDPSTGTSG
jgi:hypothetical protein